MLFLNVHLPSKPQGFTLLETMVVVAMIGILSAFAAPSILSIHAQKKLDNSLEKVQSSLELSQADAVKKGRTCQVYIPDGNQIITECNADSAGNITSQGISGVPNGLQVSPLDEGVTMSSNLTGTPKKIVYGFRGTTNNNVNIILSSNATSLQKCLVVYRGIGLIRTGNMSGGNCVNYEY